MITFEVTGLPRAKGSWKPIKTKHGKIIMMANKDKDGIDRNKEWEIMVADKALVTMQDKPLMEGALLVLLAFTFPRPKSITVKKRPHHTVSPDLDKLVRACLDAMTHTVYMDDSQIVSINATKSYCNEDQRPGVSIEVRPHPSLIPIAQTLPMQC